MNIAQLFEGLVNYFTVAFTFDRLLLERAINLVLVVDGPILAAVLVVDCQHFGGCQNEWVPNKYIS